MNFNKTTEYSLRILIYISKHSPRTISATELYTNLNLPYKFVSKILTQLSKLGFISTQKGRDGGAILAAPSEKLKIIDIIKSLESKDVFEKCILGFSKCNSKNPCSLHNFWAAQRDELYKEFSILTLSDLNTNKLSRF